MSKRNEEEKSKRRKEIKQGTRDSGLGNGRGGRKE